MNNEQYRSIIYIFKSSKDATEKYDIPELMNYQFHLIARIDDTTQVQIENLQKNDYFHLCLKTRLHWSKM